ncbi:hypothetical protein [Sphingobacterium sp.]|uniref:hypothetical protein n=1 Tax=Sphingobacterium sp. TaxID=341027 RepID=UPI0028AA36C0|nr:hypothetical protein [Sphingobacterium sp.]
MEQLKRKPMIAWGIKRSTGLILPFSIRYTRRDAIKELESSHKSQWKQLKKQGMSAVKLEIRELQKTSIGKPAKDPCQPFPQLDLFK